MAIHIVLDIDGVLAGSKAANIGQASFFKNKGAIHTATRTHYIFPGVIDFIKLLFQTKGIKVSFFSSGEKDRNIKLINQLLKLAQIKDRVQVFSKNNLIESTYQERHEHYKQWGIHAGTMLKNLSLVLSENDKMEDVVLIDDDSSYVAQPGNYLYVPTTDNESFSKLACQRINYQPEGYKYLRCIIATEKSSDVGRSKVNEGSQILLLKKENGFEVCFIDRITCALQSRLIENRELISELNEIAELPSIIRKIKIIRSICDLVHSWGGKSRKICRRANRIYYITGLLFSALKESQAKGIPISRSLFNRQFELNKKTGGYKPIFNRSKKNDEIYLYGLKILQGINKDLQLITPESYHKDCTNLPALEKERFQLYQAIQNQNTCCIM